MFGMLLIVAQWWNENHSTQLVGCATPPRAQVVQSAWNHATALSEVPNDSPWPLSENAAPFVDGLPPSPAILNAQGWKNVAGVLRTFWIVPQMSTTDPIDSSKDPKDLSPVTDEVADLIAKWEKAAEPRPMLFEFRRTTYDLNRQVETRTKGVFQYASSCEGGFRFDNETSNSGSVSERKDPEGNQYVIEAGTSEEWHWSAQEILHIHNTNKTYAIAPFPGAEKQDSNTVFRQTIEARAPFIINVRGDVMRREWTFTQLSRVGYECILEAIPRTAARRRHFNRCLLRLDSESGRLTAIKYVDADQVHETVYVIDRFRKFTPIEGCRFPSRQVRLKGYRNVPMTPQ